MHAPGYKIDVREAEALLDQLDTGHTGDVNRGQLAASQIDWEMLQRENMPLFLDAAKHAFASLDSDGDGIWSCEEILDCLRSRLAPTEVWPHQQETMFRKSKNSQSIEQDT